ncbi:endoribonuclease Dicer homolog 2 isoform X2 [Prosopis cineraria]|uniref:endoribonuclease Dicer homolog 2 isoform X2 n=1 Tax=Prosopis cineraria TaxID=364024 RepID=UPI00240ECA49|nr:endoribonuclease Dicer homolog 2 isoform X2 [Prosopis cineraria]
MEIDAPTFADPLSFARSYQLEALEKAIRQNTIVFLETGSGKTLIAIMLLRSYAYLLRKPSPFVAFFLVPKVVLVKQQAEAVKMHTDLKVGMYWGDMGVDFWDAAQWAEEIQKHEILVMTPAILLAGLRHSFFKLNMIKVLIMDECHHAKGRDPYACIMTEFYHPQLQSKSSDLPRIFGMTASPIKSKGGNSELTLWKNIAELESLMDSKVYTCASASVLSEFVPISTPKFKFYKHTGIPFELFKCLADKLNLLKKQAAEFLSYNEAFLSSNEAEFFSYENMDVSGQTTVRRFTLNALEMISTCILSGPRHTIGSNVRSNMDAGLLTSKVLCLTDSLLEYRDLNDMRCIIFVERIITAIALDAFLREFLPNVNGWKTKYIAGNNSGLQNQTRKKQNEIVEEFRVGLVNIIVATSILEEGLDVQSCNVVIRFDPSATVCSFIQSRGRARVQNSDYILMVESGDLATRSRLEKYLTSGEIMRKECLRHSSLPCEPFNSDLYNKETYCVESTGAIVNLSSSIGLIYLYCSRLPADGYFKPMPRWDQETGTLLLPKSCPISSVCVQGSKKTLKNMACLEACIQLHKNGALTDNLVPDIVIEKNLAEEFVNEPYNEEQPHYVPPELVNCLPHNGSMLYHCYLIELNQEFNYDVAVRDFVLAMRYELDPEIGCMEFKMCVDRGDLMVKFRYIGTINLGLNEVLLCRRFQITVFGILLAHNIDKLTAILNELHWGDNLEIDYLMLPATAIDQRPLIVDWPSVTSIFSSQQGCNNHGANVRTKDALVCSCKLENSLVCTPHNGQFYITTGRMKLNGNSVLRLSNGRITTYKKYYKEKHGIDLRYEHQQLYNGRHMFHVQNYLHRSRQVKERESTKASVELPPELCSIIMSPISVSIIYSFSFIPSIIHRLESLLLASNLKKLCMQNDIPTVKILEAITTKKCQESFHYESLETLGDSFLKYAAGQYLYQTHPSYHEGLLSVKKDRIISNAALRKFGCSSRLPGFIRNSPFDPHRWIIPGNSSEYVSLKEELASDTTKIYVSGNRKIKPKIIADVVEALIGACLITGGEKDAFKFMDWIGIKVDFKISPNKTHLSIHAEKLVNVRFLESKLNYSFNDRSLLVEALTHGSYMLPEIPKCYQRLEFLGDAVLDFLVTEHLYNKYPDLSPGLLTDMRSASVNNDCYARSAIKADLHKHILHASQELHRDIVSTINDFDKLSSEPTFGWETRKYFPKVLGDIIESLAGAIMVDSGFNKETVFRSIMPLLEPLITPETLQIHPVRELQELCSKRHYIMEKPLVSTSKGLTYVTVRVLVNGKIYEETCEADHKKTAKKLACKEVLTSLKKINLA